MPQLPDHTKGLLITILGVLIITPDALLIRLIDLDPWSTAFWRGLLLGCCIFLFIFLRSPKQCIEHYRSIGKAGLILSLTYSISSLCFVWSITNTSTAHTLIIIATAPMFAVIFSFLALKERISKVTLLAIGSAFSGVVLVMSDHDLNEGSLYGDVFALGTAIAIALAFTLVRRSKHIDMLPATSLAGFIIALSMLPMMLIFGKPLTYSGDTWGYILIMGIFAQAIPFGLLTIGPRYITAPEVSLILLLETILGPFWVWWILDEKISQNTMIGGSIVIITLILHTMYKLAKRYRIPSTS